MIGHGDGRAITVLGGGLAGLAVAVALARQGARVRVLERAEALREAGAGIQVSPNGVAVLDALGVERRGLPSSAVDLRDGPSGRGVARLPLGHAPRPYLLCHRAELLGALAERARALSVTIDTGRAVTDVVAGDGEWHLGLAGGGSLQAGCLIGADGLHSVVRPVLDAPSRPFFTGQVAWRSVVPGEAAPEAAVFMGPGRHLVRYPLSGGRINLVGVEERADWAAEGWSHEGDADGFRAAFAGFAPEVRTLLERVETVHLWGLFRHRVAAKWHAPPDGPPAAILGDAAHPTLPFLAQGANLALEDAWVLADCVARTDIVKALPLYQERRRDRVRRAIAAANANARNYHLRNPIARGMAHAGLRAVSAVAPTLLVRKFDWLYLHDVTA